MSEASDQPVAEEPIVSPEPGVADEANAQGDHESTETDDEGTDLDEDGNPIEPVEDDSEEIELEGKKYKVPKDLKDGYLRQADYTQKTQTVAEQKRAVEAEKAAWEQQRTQQAEFIKEMREDVGKVHILEAEFKRFEGVDWRAAQQQIAALAADPQAQFQAQQQYNLAWSQFTASERELQQAKSALTEKEQRLSQEQTQRVQASMREAVQALQRDIPGFNQEIAGKILEHGKAFGLTPEEAQQLSDPRIWKLLQSDRSKADEIAALKAENAKLKGQRTAVQSNAAAQQVRPAAPVKGNAKAPTGPRDDMDIKAWVKAEEARMARKAG
jgi:hypothetical protein